MPEQEKPSIQTIPSINTQAWEVKTRRRSIIRDFALNTSTHALPGIARSQSKHNRIFWTVSFLLFTGVMILFVVQSITNYFKYQTQTIIEVAVERNQLFPAVTICNVGAARYDLLQGPLFNFTNSRNLTNTNDTSNVTPQMVLHLQNFLVHSINTGDSPEQYLFHLETMLMSCTYNTQPCNKSDFISFTSPLYGLCYTFNAQLRDRSNTHLRRVNDYGGSGKLELRLYAHHHLYLPFFLGGVSAGMVAMLHDSAEVPLIDVAGVELAAGRKHKLAYRKKASYFLPPPYTECTTKVPDVIQHMFSRYGGADYKYSQGVCYILCAQAYMFEQCGCVNAAQWLARSVKLKNTSEIITAPLCKPMDPCVMAAMLTLSTSDSVWDQFCSDCKQECTTVEYRVTPSGVSAPNAEWTAITKSFVEGLNITLPQNWSTNWASDIPQSYVALDVVCETTLIENYTQEASMTAVDVLSNVGGQTGLWIGISFLSVMEVVEMLYRLLRHECRVWTRRIQNRVRP